MASENKIKERELEKEQNLKVLLKKIAEDNQNNTKIIKKTHKGEIEIEVNSPNISYLEENSEPSKKETNVVPKISPEQPLIASDNALIDRSDSGLFSDEDLDEIRNQKPLSWSCRFKSEFSSSFMNVTMLSASKCENSFAIKIRNEFFKENLDLSIEDFDYFKCKNDDLMVQLKHVTNKNDLVFVKFEKSNKTIRTFYSNLYNYLVKQQSSIKNLLCYARMNLKSEHSDFISKLYLLPLKNKNVSLDENLKNLFSIEVNRNTNLILGVFVSNKIKLNPNKASITHPHTQKKKRMDVEGKAIAALSK
jgi:plasmid maintenance system killer protein